MQNLIPDVLLFLGVVLWVTVALSVRLSAGMVWVLVLAGVGLFGFAVHLHAM